MDAEFKRSLAANAAGDLLSSSEDTAFQRGKCNIERAGVSTAPTQCFVCSGRIINDSCRFEDFRVLDNPVRFASGSPVKPVYSTVFDSKPTVQEVLAFRYQIALLLRPILLEELSHEQLPCLIRKYSDEYRVTCDVCSTSILSATFLCSQCGFEICPTCYGSECFRAVELVNCACKHAEMLPVSRLPDAAVSTTLQQVDVTLTLTTTDVTPAIGPSNSVQKLIESAAKLRFPPLLNDSARLRYDLKELGAHRLPVLIKNIGAKLSGCWSPEGFGLTHGDHTVMMMDSRHKDPVPVAARSFLQELAKSEEERGCVIKVKDFPPSQGFSDVAPTYFSDFMNVLPIPSHMKHNGFHNLAAHWPQPSARNNTFKPDLGPKMYMGSADRSAIGQLHKAGSTCLHKGITNTVNLNTFSGQGALWHIFLPKDSDAIRKYLKDHPSYTPDMSDPLHSQKMYLRESDLCELTRRGVVPFEFLQEQGDMITIPAGCTHQVSNLSSSIKIAVDYVNVESSFESALTTKELQQEQIEEVLQLRAMIWHTWQSVSNYMELQGIEINAPAPNEQKKGYKARKRAAQRATMAAKNDRARRKFEKRKQKLTEDEFAEFQYPCPHPDCRDRRHPFTFWGVHSHIRSEHHITIDRDEWLKFNEEPPEQWSKIFTELVLGRSKVAILLPST